MKTAYVGPKEVRSHVIDKKPFRWGVVGSRWIRRGDAAGLYVVVSYGNGDRTVLFAYDEAMEVWFSTKADNLSELLLDHYNLAFPNKLTLPVSQMKMQALEHHGGTSILWRK